jgi:hypothetical protein
MNAENERKAESGETVYRCGTVAPKRQDGISQAQVDRWVQENRIVAGGVIPVYFHVIYKTQRGQEIGNVPQSWIDAQMTVLNRNYGGRDYNGNVVSGAANTGYTFTLAGVSRTNSNKWFGMVPGSRSETDAKNALVVNPAGALNIYTCQPGQNLLGWSYFPQDAAATTSTAS